MKSNDDYFMRTALKLARRGLGKTSPNPMVGALIIKGNEIMGKGYHRYFGGKHAEINAIEDTEDDTSGTTLYVTLEPCCHRGKKTPPCLDTLLQHNFRRVVIGTRDPNPQVSGRSIEALRQRGIEVVVGVLEEECRQLNEVYFKFIQTGMPFVTIKYAQTLDGKIATSRGDSRWISSGQSLKLAHKLRSQHDAVLVGAGTVLTDNPQLTVRLIRGRNPIRIVVDSKLNISLKSRILQEQHIATTIVATTSQADPAKLSSLRGTGIECLILKEDDGGRVDLKNLLKTLGSRNVSSILVEGGPTIITSLIRLNIADRFVLIQAPKILGKGIEAIGDLGVSKMDQALILSFTRMYRRGVDLVIEARLIDTAK